MTCFLRRYCAYFYTIVRRRYEYGIQKVVDAFAESISEFTMNFRWRESGWWRQNAAGVGFGRLVSKSTSLGMQRGAGRRRGRCIARCRRERPRTCRRVWVPEIFGTVTGRGLPGIGYLLHSCAGRRAAHCTLHTRGAGAGDLVPSRF